MGGGGGLRSSWLWAGTMCRWRKREECDPRKPAGLLGGWVVCVCVCVESGYTVCH